MNCKFNLLSIDGGGIRGIIPAIILAEIEKRTNKRISELFDLIAGTSTGGLVALALNKPNPAQPNVALYTARDLVELYRNHGRRIFDEQESFLDDALEQAYDQFRHLLQNLPRPINLPEIDINSLRGSKFPSTGREEVLTEFLGETLIKEALKEVFITSYDTELRTPIFFTSNQQNQTEERRNFRKICDGYTMKQAAMATSAAPTYFAPYKVDTIATDSGYYSLIDGGVFANNPTSLATLEAIISHRKATKETLNLDEILVVSLGTGSLTRQYLYENIKDWGSLDWGRSLLGIVLDGQSESVACQLEQLLPDSEGDPKQYYRFQGLLNDANDDIDVTTSENIADLEKVARLIVQQRDRDLDRLCEQLVASQSKVKS
jgi:uncharacterized protein